MSDATLFPSPTWAPDAVAGSRLAWRPALKRALDVAMATVALVLTLPLLVVLAVAVRLDSPGPVLFRQRRVGLNGREFEVLKIRSMVANAEALRERLQAANEADGPLFKITHDPRITRVGGWLRKLSLDELPQLFNVVRGDMSLVGPRPALPQEVATYDRRAARRLLAKPGITGPWQVSDRHQSSFEDYLALDLDYVENWSLGRDLALIARTVPAVLQRTGV
ncbi:MAG: sugar transferase [Actinobacteria bacterium]|nr:sugar transferase [Actinomycetota bacterium]